MAVHWALSRRDPEVQLVEVMDDAMHRIKDDAVRVILPTAGHVFQVELRARVRRIRAL